MFQSYGIAVGLESMHGSFGAAVVEPGGCSFVCLLRRHARRRHDVPDVARRADHRARHRQWHQPDHLRRHRRQPAARAGDAAGTRAHRRAEPGVHPGLPGDRGRGDRLHRLHGAGAAADRRAVSQAPGRPAHVRRRLDPHAAEDQHLRRDPADLRQLDPADPGDRRGLLRPGRRRLDRHDRQRACPRPAGLHGRVCRHDHLLQLFLHRRRVQPAGDGGQSQEIRRLRPRHPSRQRTRPSISTRC